MYKRYCAWVDTLRLKQVVYIAGIGDGFALCLYLALAIVCAMAPVPLWLALPAAFINGAAIAGVAMRIFRLFKLGAES